LSEIIHIVIFRESTDHFIIQGFDTVGWGVLSVKTVPE